MYILYKSKKIFVGNATAADGLTDEQQQIQKVALDFAKNEFSPNMEEWDAKVRLYSDTQIVQLAIHRFYS